MVWWIAGLLGALICTEPQSDLERRIESLQTQVEALDQREAEILSLQNRVQELEAEVQAAFPDSGEISGVLLFLIGIFCAIWAQNTGRGAWLWFFLGVFFHVITLIFLCQKNSQDLEAKRQPKLS